MICRLLLTASLVAIAVGVPPVYAQQPVPDATPAAPGIPKNTCAKPDTSRIGGTAESMRGAAGALRMSAFNRDYKTYSECIKKYVEETNAISSAASAAGKAAIEEFNAVTAEAKARSEAANN